MPSPHHDHGRLRRLPLHRRPLLVVLGLVWLLVIGGCASEDADPAAVPGGGERPSATTGTGAGRPDGSAGSPAPPTRVPGEPPRGRNWPPPPVQGSGSVFAAGAFLVAYYGTAGTGALGVLGESSPPVMQRRLERAAAPFARPGRPVKEVYELIVSVADGYPGPDGDYSHDLARADVQRYIDAAGRNGAYLLLDVQPGRTPFPQVARRWAWALRYSHVGLAIDPEWRMHGGQVPGRQIGHVDAAEINRTSEWLATFTRERVLPQKLFVLHQFRTDMVRDIGAVEDRPRLAMVQHVDGFGTPGQKLATYRAVARPGQFQMGFKLFYDEDVRRLGPPAVHRIRPPVRFVSFQ